jgi:hypothetical protein
MKKNATVFFISLWILVLLYFEVRKVRISEEKMNRSKGEIAGYSKKHPAINWQGLLPNDIKIWLYFSWSLEIF